MRYPHAALFAAASFFSLSVAAPFASHNKRSLVEREGIIYDVFEHAVTGSTIEYVKDSGICETTAGVRQYSGYLSVGDNMNMFFWFFEARQNPSNAPLAMWFNGGPGCSGLIGLFQENGPCKFELGNTFPMNNTFSFNNYANMLYIDQPIGVGFSYGNNTVNSTVTAAPYVWNLLQAFYAAFPEYTSRDFGMFTESYGGHFGPEFVRYIQEQNAAGKGEHVNIVALGINNGWYDSEIQELSYIPYSYNNTYKQLIDKKQYDELMLSYTDDCLPDLRRCQGSASDLDCGNADRVCYAVIDNTIYQAAPSFDVYDIRAAVDNPEPPKNYLDYLDDPAIKKAIGARTTYQECPDGPFDKFQRTGDGARSFLAQLGEVVSSGLSVLIWAGDADWICNWPGNYDVANVINYPGRSAFAGKDLVPYTVNGVERGEFKTQDNLSFLRVYEAGHLVMYYQPELALQVFKQTMSKAAITST
ncbi:putative carboxypeptidase S1 [Sporormia fimetaria CBS 119925]|uniref:Carboxypeptidase n=1 Tax=Sporormia fimetaria CBS 119925 TaxID=1340428 RepID=A0A6A6UZ58_9PLEO|nr:putative carboxypeptidase S1 [Sporormia fimetaria CBS 119925]